MEQSAAVLSVCAIHMLFSRGMSFTEKISPNDRAKGRHLSVYDRCFHFKHDGGEESNVLYYIKNAFCHGRIDLSRNNITVCDYKDESISFDARG